MRPCTPLAPVFPCLQTITYSPQSLGSQLWRTLAPAATMLLHLLLHVLIFHLLTAKGGPRDDTKIVEKEARLPLKARDTNYIIKTIDQCPDVGYYFHRDPAPNSLEPGPCYLCFCQGQHSAICWRRDNRRCNLESFQYHNIGKRDTRVRRSPGFADIFFRDASRDIFNRNVPDQQCKPYESSFSDDCPPADWCVGCTVCDCDANGRWDCHLLSFCPETRHTKNGYTGPPRKTVKKKPVTRTTTPKTTPTTVKKTSPPVKRPAANDKKRQKRMFTKRVTPKPFNTPQKKKQPIKYKRVAPIPDPKKTTMIKKNVATHKPIELKSNKLPKRRIVKRHEDNATVLLAQQVVKRVMAAVRQMVQREMRNMSRIINGERFVKENVEPAKKTTVAQPKPVAKPKPKLAAINKMREMKKRLVPVAWSNRRKRDIEITELDAYSPSVAPIGTEAEIDTEPTVTEKAIDTVTTDGNFSIVALKPVTTTPTIQDQTIHTENEYYKYNVDSNKISNQIEEVNAILENNEIKTTGEYAPNTINYVDYIVDNKTYENIIHNTQTTPIYNTEVFFNIKPENILSTKIEINTATKKNLTNKVLDTLKYLTDNTLNANDLKYSKWHQLKMIKEKKLKPYTERAKNVVFVDNVTENKNKRRGKDIGRITVAKRYNLVKIMNRHRCPFLINYLNESETNGQAVGNKITNLQGILRRILRNRQNNTKFNRRPKNNPLKYLKKVFNKIFTRKSTFDRFNKQHIIETLCESFGPCKVNLKDKALLRSKLSELDHETMSIMKTVKIIKGLLRLLDGPQSLNTSSSRRNQNDIQLLNCILRGTYENHSKHPLTGTQLIQIDYLKKNTKDFIGSVGKFAMLLNQIISILTKGDGNTYSMEQNLLNKPIKDDQFKRLKRLLINYNLVQNDFMRKMYDLLNNFENKNIVQPQVSPVAEVNSSVAIENFSRNIIKNLRKLKNLAQTLSSSGRTKRETKDDDALEYLLMLMEYILKQNHPLDDAPVDDGIDLLIDAIKSAPDIKTVRKKVLNNTPATEVYVTPKNIHYKRPITGSPLSEGDDSWDKSSNNDTTSTSNESINIKIEDKENEIKNKIESNKQLLDVVDDDNDYQYNNRRAEAFPYFFRESTTETNILEKIFSSSAININSNSSEVDTRKPNIERSGIDNLNIKASDIFYNSHFNDNKENDSNTENNNLNDNPTNNIIDDGNNYNGDAGTGHYKYYFNDNAGFFNSQNENIVNANNYNTDTDKNNKVKEIVEESTTVRGAIEWLHNNGVKKFETMFTGVMDDDDVVSTVPTIDARGLKTISPQGYKKPKHKPKQIKTLDAYDNDNLDKKSKLEWIEENFGRVSNFYEEENIKEDTKDDIKADIKEGIKGNVREDVTPFLKVDFKENIEENDKKVETTTHIVEVPSEIVSIKPKNFLKGDVSTLSNEVNDRAKQKKHKMNIEEVMLKKQMDLLNSLDYGTEKSDPDESDSKDGNADEKYAEPYPSDFV